LVISFGNLNSNEPQMGGALLYWLVELGSTTSDEGDIATFGGHELTLS